MVAAKKSNGGWFPKDKGGVKYLTYGPMGKSQMSMRKPIKLSTAFLVFFPNHLFLPECGWISYCMEWEEYGQKNSNWAENHFLKNVFWLPWQGKCPKMYAIRPYIHVFIFLTILLHVGAFGSSWSFSCVFHSRFWLLASFFPWMGGRFCSAGDWVVFPHDLGAAGAFPIHDFVWSSSRTASWEPFAAIAHDFLELL